MRVITPTEITDTNYTNSIPEPDASVGESVWEDKPYTSTVNANTSGDYWLVTSISHNGSEYVFKRLDSPTTLYATVSGSFDNPIVLFDVASDISSGYITGVTFFNNEYHVAVRDAGVYKILTYDALGAIIGSFTLIDVDTGKSVSLCSSQSGLTAFLVSDLGENVARRFSFFGAFIDEFTMGNATTIDCEQQEGFYYTTTPYSINKYTSLFELVESKLINTLDGNGFYAITYNPLYDYLLTSTSASGSNPQILIYYYRNLETINNYQVDAELISTSTHKVYSCIIPTTDEPEIGAAKDIPTWVEVGATNKYAMFDDNIGNPSTANSAHVFFRLLGKILPVE